MMQGRGRKGQEAVEFRGNAPGPLLYHTLLNVGTESDSGVRPASVRVLVPALTSGVALTIHSACLSALPAAGKSCICLTDDLRTQGPLRVSTFQALLCTRTI